MGERETHYSAFMVKPTQIGALQSGSNILVVSPFTCDPSFQAQFDAALLEFAKHTGTIKDGDEIDDYWEHELFLGIYNHCEVKTELSSTDYQEVLKRFVKHLINNDSLEIKVSDEVANEMGPRMNESYLNKPFHSATIYF